MTNQLPSVHEAEHHTADWSTSRPVVAGTQGVVAAGHPLVTMAGMRMLITRGFPMYEYMHRMLAIPETRSQFDVYPPGGHDVFYPGGRMPRVGELFVQPALGRTLAKLVQADGEVCGGRIAGIAAARERFYK